MQIKITQTLFWHSYGKEGVKVVKVLNKGVWPSGFARG